MYRKIKLILNMALLVTIVAFTTVMCVFAARGVGVTSEYTISFISPYCFLVDGQDVNLAMKKVVTNSTSSYTTNDNKIQHVVFDFWDDSIYGSTFNWDTSSSASVDATENSNIRLFWKNSSKTMYVLSYSLIAANNCESMFQNFTALQSVDFKNFDSVQSTTMEKMFYGDTNLSTISHSEKLSTNLATTLNSMFYNCSSLASFDATHFRTPLCSNMSNMFYGCSALASINLSNFEVGNVTTFSQMFYGCTNLSILTFNDFSSPLCTNMSKMFYNCSSLTTLNLSNFNTTLVSNFEGMFYGCSGITNLNLSSFSSANATTFKDMFYGCTSLDTLDISGLTSDKVTDMSQMFAGTKLTELDLAKFDTSLTTNMNKMFYNMTEIETIYASNLWTTINVTNGTDIFTGDTQLVGGFGTTYSGSNTGLSYAHVDVPDGPGYLTAADVQYKGVFIYDEYNTLISVSYVGTESPYTLPTADDYDYFKNGNTNYNPGQTLDYDIFDGTTNVEFTLYYLKYNFTPANGDNGSYVNRTVTYTHKGQTKTAINNKSNTTAVKIPYNAEVTVSVSLNTTESRYSNPALESVKYTSGGTTVSVTTVTQYSTYKFTMPKTNVTATFKCSYSSGGFCVASGTLITLVDGTTKKVEDITLDDKLLIYNHETGNLDGCDINFIEVEEKTVYEVVNLVFSNGTTSRMISEHGYFDLTLGKYMYIHTQDCKDFIGHQFYAITDNGTPTVVTLENAYVTKEYTGCYSLTTKYHLNYFVDNMLSMPGGIRGLFNIFEYDENLKYDEADKQQAIEEFGLFEYADFEDFITYEQFCLYPAPYLKVALGRGLLVWENIEYMIERYC